MNSLFSRRIRVAVVFLAATAAGCASGPIKFEQPPVSVSVEQARAVLIDEDTQSTPLVEELVLWGGTILNVANLADTTQIEVMGYPLDRRQRPQVQRAAQGRFVATFDCFVEPLDFPVGRAVTVLGDLGRPITGVVGEATYLYPVVDVNDSHVWSAQELSARSGVTFGIGVNLSN